VTFTGDDCVQAGPDAFQSREIVTITLKNETSVEVAVVVLDLDQTTLKESVADDVRLFPPNDSWPPLVSHPDEAHSTWVVGSNSEIERQVAFFHSGDYGTVCWPIDGNPAIEGALLTIDE
jgi:hypothetical protein